MQRWIIAGVVVLLLLAGGGLFVVRKIKLQGHDHQYLCLPFNANSTPEQRASSEKEMRERLLTDAILTGVARDCDIVSKWGLPSESAAVEELRRRAKIEAGIDPINNVPTEVLRVGFNGVVAEHKDLRALSQRLMEDVRRLIQPQQPVEPAPVGADKF